MQSLLTGLTAEHVPDAKLFAIALAALACCIVWLGAAAWRHRRNLRAIPVRIHVAGTRGKSTTTRLIAAGLHADSLRVVAKTTGTEPRLIRPDGSEVAWPRRRPPSLRQTTQFSAQPVGACGGRGAWRTRCDRRPGDGRRDHRPRRLLHARPCGRRQGYALRQRLRVQRRRLFGLAVACRGWQRRPGGAAQCTARPAAAD